MRKYVSNILLILLSLSLPALAEERAVYQWSNEPADVYSTTSDTEDVLELHEDYRDLMDQADVNSDNLIEGSIDGIAPSDGKIADVSIYGTDYTGSEWVNAINTDEIFEGDMSLPLTSDQKLMLHSTAKLAPISVEGLRVLRIPEILNTSLKKGNKIDAQRKTLGLAKFKISRQTGSLAGAVDIFTDDLVKQSRLLLGRVSLETEAAVTRNT